MTITLRLVLPPESQRVSFDDHATVRELFQKVCQSFGLSSCSLQYGYPPKALTFLNNSTTQHDTLRSVGIQNQDRITVTPIREADATDKTTTMANTKSNYCIPGLTEDHYIKSSSQSTTSTPKLISMKRLQSSSSFQVRWTASGSRGESYSLSAEGDILGKDNELVVHCDCVAFSKRGENKTHGKVRVCKHLKAALDTVIDPLATNRKSNTVVDLLSDSSSSCYSRENEKPQASQKRPATAPVARKKTKKPRIINTTPINTQDAPIQLFATQCDVAERRHAPPSHPCFTQCKTLPEMVFGNEGGDDLQWMVLANFLIDFDYLVDGLPQLLTIPRLVVFVSDKVVPVPTNIDWAGTGHADFVPLNPGADPQTRANPMKYRFEYGSHHTKLFLVGYKNKIRVVVSTGNLRPGDVVKVNAAYVEEFPLKQQSESGTTTSDFEESLVHYVRSYGYTKKRKWLNQRESLEDVLQRYDYSQAKAVLIPSIPGYHNIESKTPRLGQLKVRQAIQQYTSPTKRPRPVVCQFSSIGSLSEAYLHTLQTSMDTCLAQDGSKGTCLLLKLVYPTVEEIRTSVEGYLGGDSVPGRKNNVSKPFLMPMWHKWSSSSADAGAAATSNNPLLQPKHVPHIKSYYQTDGANGFDWLVITSHNISQAAWGTIRKNNRNNHGGGQGHLYIRSWELGVFVSPKTLGVQKLVPFFAGGQQPPSTPDTTATVPMPYATHDGLQRYGPNDLPWACDEVYQLPDAFGLHSCMGHPTPTNPGRSI